MITIIGPKQITLPPPMGPSMEIWSLLLICTTRGLFVKDIGDDKMKLEGITDLSLINPVQVANLVKAGCEILGYPALVEVNLEDEVPESFRLVDEEGNNLQTTWGQWASANEREPIVKDDRIFVPLSNSKGYLPASQWVSLNSNLTIISTAQLPKTSNDEIS